MLEKKVHREKERAWVCVWVVNIPRSTYVVLVALNVQRKLMNMTMVCRGGSGGLYGEVVQGKVLKRGEGTGAET